MIEQPEAAAIIEAGPATFQVRAEKDLHQAAEVLAVLVEDRPGDIALAWVGEDRPQRARPACEAPP